MLSSQSSMLTLQKRMSLSLAHVPPAQSWSLGATFLQGPHFGNENVAFIHSDRQHFPVADETHRIFDHHHLVAKLDRRTRLATLDQFRVGFKQAEQFVGVGNFFVLHHAAISGTSADS